VTPKSGGGAAQVGSALVTRTASGRGRPALRSVARAVLHGWLRLPRRMRRPGSDSQYGTRGSTPVLAALPNGETRCVACHLCAAACPSQCIGVAPALPGTCGGFDLDMGRCIQCGLCVEACPVGALAAGPGHVVGGKAMVAAQVDSLRYDRQALVRPA